jgi:catechol 2,3-dioxygenase-like lactoylglutathione lyase family enzyme
MATVCSNVGMLDHLSIQAADFDASTAFYDRVLAALGGRRLVDPGDVVGYGTDRPSFWVGRQGTGDGFRESPRAPRFCTSRDYGRSTTRTTSGRLSEIPTATISKPSATNRGSGTHTQAPGMLTLALALSY